MGGRRVVPAEQRSGEGGEGGGREDVLSDLISC